MFKCSNSTTFNESIVDIGWHWSNQPKLAFLNYLQWKIHDNQYDDEFEVDGEGDWGIQLDEIDKDSAIGGSDNSTVYGSDDENSVDDEYSVDDENSIESYNEFEVKEDIGDENCEEASNIEAFKSAVKEVQEQVLISVDEEDDVKCQECGARTYLPYDYVTTECIPLCNDCMVSISGHENCVQPNCSECVTIINKIVQRTEISQAFCTGTLITNNPIQLSPSSLEAKTNPEILKKKCQRKRSREPDSDEEDDYTTVQDKSFNSTTPDVPKRFTLRRST